MATSASTSSFLCVSCGGIKNESESICKSCVSDLVAIVTPEDNDNANEQPNQPKLCVTCSEALDPSDRQIQCRICLEVAFDCSITPKKSPPKGKAELLVGSPSLDDDGVKTLVVRSPGSLIREKFQKARDNGQVIELLLSSDSKSASTNNKNNDECIIVDIESPGTSLEQKFEQAARERY